MFRTISLIAAAILFGLYPAHAQTLPDGPTADPAHYTVVFENDHVHVVRIHYGPGDRSPMHSHAAGTYLYLTDGKVRFTLPSGTTTQATLGKGAVTWGDAHAHAVENVGDAGFEILVVEPKRAAAQPVDAEAVRPEAARLPPREAARSRMETGSYCAPSDVEPYYEAPAGGTPLDLNAGHRTQPVLWSVFPIAIIRPSQI